MGVTCIVFVLYHLFVDTAVAKTVDRVNVTVAVELLDRYGYLNRSNISMYSGDVMPEAVAAYQDYYKLRVDGELNNETLDFLSKPRCGVADHPTPLEFSLYPTRNKWKIKELTWYSRDRNPELIKLIDKAFHAWAQHTTLKFKRVFTQDANIILGFDRKKHPFIACGNIQMCAPFDEEGYILGHAYPPMELAANCTEVHFSLHVSWYIGPCTSPDDSLTDIYPVILHEIGHALSISHTSRNDSIMYSSSIGVKELSEDDILAIQSLYGPPNTGRQWADIPKYSPVSSSTSTTTSTTQRTPSTTQRTAPTTVPAVVTTPAIPLPKQTPENVETLPSLCDVRLKITSFIILNDKLYLIYKKWLWMMDLKSRNISETLKLANYIHFLPPKFNSLTTFYQKPSSEVLLFINDRYYVMRYPSMQLLYQGNNSHFFLSPDMKILGAVTTYTGRTYIFHEHDSFIEIDNCYDTYMRPGLISKEFNGVPGRMEGVFRYTNGYIYFFQNNFYFEYDEFTNSLIRTGPMTEFFTSILKLPDCPNIDLLVELKALLVKITANDLCL